MLNIAIIGTGPTAIYTLKYLVEQNMPVDITMFEAQAEAGKGTPYHQDWNNDMMLANIASIEIPAVVETLVQWLEGQDEYKLASMGLTHDDIDERAFYPRVVLGNYFQDQLRKLVAKAKSKKINIEIKAKTRVEDVSVKNNRVIIHTAGSIKIFSHVVMATGHVWPKESEVKPGYFISPWPPVALNTIENCAVGILGTSLSAIDAMVTLSTVRGTFRRENGIMQYLPEPGTQDFSITLMSRKGLLPEADFYHTIPYLPLQICTPENIQIILSEKNDLLDRAYELFKSELLLTDKAYARRLDIEDLTLEEFSHAYFKQREQHDTFVWAKANLEEAQINQDRKFTVPWRYAILRMHEVIGAIVPNLSAEDHQRFNRFFKPIFVDDYATVPHESIERVLAMHAAGKLQVIRLGEDYELDKERPEGGASLSYDGKTIHYPAFIEATGQRTLSARDFPFPSLWKEGIIKNATVPHNAKGKAEDFKVGGIALDMAYHPVWDSPDAYRLYCPSIPFMLGQFPFAQGITSSHDMGKVIVEDMLQNMVSHAEEEAQIDARDNHSESFAN